MRRRQRRVGDVYIPVVNRRVCIRCGEKQGALVDEYGIPWCEKHQDRALLFAIGQRLDTTRKAGWSELHAEPYAIAEGLANWFFVCIFGHDAMINTCIRVLQEKGFWCD